MWTKILYKEHSKEICCQHFSYLVLTPPPPVPSESTCGMPALTQVLPITKFLCQPHFDIPFSRTVNGKSITISSAPSIKWHRVFSESFLSAWAYSQLITTESTKSAPEKQGESLLCHPANSNIVANWKKDNRWPSPHWPPLPPWWPSPLRRDPHFWRLGPEARLVWPSPRLGWSSNAGHLSGRTGVALMT